MSQYETYAVIAIPLSRPDVVDFLLARPATPQGAKLQIVGQRPTPQAEARWLTHLNTTAQPTVSDLLALDDPHASLIETFTDRLVPVESLAQSNFLTRDLGGWVANYFGVAGLPKQPWVDDPLLNELEILTDYGSHIDYLGGDPNLVQTRLAEEMEGDIPHVIAALVRIHNLRRKLAAHLPDYIERLYSEIASQNYFAQDNEPPLPDLLLYDELAGRLVELELRRRAALARSDDQEATAIKIWQQTQEAESGLRLILQGEYIVGRHRRSAIIIAPALGVVIKQPAPEPFHDIAIGNRLAQGRQENWPAITNGGQLVTARGRIRLILEENVVPRLSRVFNHQVRFSALLGLTIEPYVVGQTVQDFVLADHSRLTAPLYETIVLHQRVCELMQIDNNDWHAPNFVRRPSDGSLVHIDWGAARPLEAHELTPDQQLARLNQVRNMAFSFKDPGLAERLTTLHTELITNETRMAQLQQQAQALVEAAQSRLSKI